MEKDSNDKGAPWYIIGNSWSKRNWTIKPGHQYLSGRRLHTSLIPHFSFRCSLKDEPLDCLTDIQQGLHSRFLQDCSKQAVLNRYRCKHLQRLYLWGLSTEETGKHSNLPIFPWKGFDHTLYKLLPEGLTSNYHTFAAGHDPPRSHGSQWALLTSFYLLPTLTIKPSY